MSFRLNAKNVYLTYPKCPLPKEEVLSQLLIIFQERGRSVNHYLVAQEKHKDGRDHLHCILWLDGKINVRLAWFADLNGESTSYHGNYQALKKERECVKYVTKEDGNYLTDSGERISKILKQKSRKLDTVATLIMSGKSIKEIATEYPGLAMSNLQKMKNFQTFWRMGEFIPGPWKSLNNSMNSSESSIVRWMGENLFETSRPIRTKNLFIYGEGRLGKTTLIDQIEASIKTYKPTPQVKWWDGFDNSFDLIVFDEFCGQWPITEMNKVLDGQRMILPQRGGDFQKTRNIPVIILSNDPPDSLYKNVSYNVLQAFISRLKIVNVTTFIKIFNE